MTLKINSRIFSGSDPFVVFAKASILMNCKIQTICVKINIRVDFNSPVMNEDCLKMLYYHHDNLGENFTMCQRVVEIRMNEENKDPGKQVEPDFSELCIQKGEGQLSRDYYIVYGYDFSRCIYKIGMCTSLSIFFKNFFAKIPTDSSIAFIDQNIAIFVPLFVKALLRHLGRKPPIDATLNPCIVQTCLSNNEPRMDLIASTLNNMKTEFIISFSSYIVLKEQKFARNATSFHICLANPSTDEFKAMKFLSSEKNQESDQAYPTHRNNMEKYLSRVVSH